MTTRSSVAEGLHDAMCQLKSCHRLHSCTNITFRKACSRWLTLKATQRYPNCRDLIGHTGISLRINGLTKQRLRLTQFPRYCHIYSVSDYAWHNDWHWKVRYIIFEQTVLKLQTTFWFTRKDTGIVDNRLHSTLSAVMELGSFLTAKVTFKFKVIQGHR